MDSMLHLPNGLPVQSGFTLGEELPLKKHQQADSCGVNLAECLVVIAYSLCVCVSFSSKGKPPNTATKDCGLHLLNGECELNQIGCNAFIANSPWQQAVGLLQRAKMLSLRPSQSTYNALLRSLWLSLLAFLFWRDTQGEPARCWYPYRFWRILNNIMGHATKDKFVCDMVPCCIDNCA